MTTSAIRRNLYYCRVVFFKAVSIPTNESKHFVLDLVVLVLAPKKATINKGLMQGVIFVNIPPYVSIL